ncbi:MAG: carbohydrate binding family 9 domain-containing protein [Candidatus Eisenbacteria bacterium]|uniref:Carbohydrate binding family 9 domain-containing protein n=1 Tax=Eiseniibacteriota bacterium TaxID=2212470 RepID=A0A849SL79_UNCEI|nr:carbohydrate binding family 9 domain-containing protein [Candidatus Eisenbacteria bacterium]
MLRHLPLLLAGLLAAGTAVPNAALAADPPPAVLRLHGIRGEIRFLAPRVAKGPLIDGSLDDAEWQQAAVLDSFTHGRPVEGVPDSLGTECFVLYDEKHLYVGFRVGDNPRLVEAPIVPRDQIWQGDWVGVSIDGYNDHQRSMFLCSNPAGIQMDGVDVEGGGDSDLAPDFLYTSRGRITANGFEVEMAIPFTTLRFASRDSVTFGFNAIRDIQRNGGHLYWSPVQRDKGPYHSQMGTLAGLADVHPGRNLQINPTVTGSSSGRREDGTLEYDSESRFGIGAKYGLTTNLTADLAITPDFSQVESDAGVVDINRRFAIFFEERRPFFLEGRDIFSTELDLVYTRRIADPLYGLRLTGKQGHTGVGLIHAMDQSAGESIESLPDARNPYHDESARFDIVRFKQDVLKNSFLGVMLADRQQRDAYNRVGFFDGRINMLERYHLSFEGAFSDARDQDLRGAIATLSPAEDSTLDASLREFRGQRRSGGAGVAILTRNTRRLDVTAGLGTMSRDFRADMGSLERTGFVIYVLEASEHYWSKNKSWWTNFDTWTEYERHDDEGGAPYFGRMVDEEIRKGGELRFARNTWLGSGYNRTFTFHDGTEFRGQNRWNFWGGSERYRLLRGGFDGSIGETVIFGEVAKGHDRVFSMWSDWRFSDQFDASLNLETAVVERDDDTRYADIVLPRLRLGYQITKELALRWITELRSERIYDRAGQISERPKSVTLDVLGTYYVRPGTVVYLGYGSLRRGDAWDAMVVTNNNIFVKLSYLWQM